MKRSGFTLIELMTVIAISSILLTIITIPMIQGFNLTRAAQGFADAQNRARNVVDQIVREVANAAEVRDNSGLKGSVAIIVPGQNGAAEELILQNAKLDLIQPMGGYPEPGASGALRNPNILIDPNGDPPDPLNWKEDPTLRTPTGQPMLPRAGGFKIVRYFIGLRTPIAADGVSASVYNNPYDGILAAKNANADNLFVLYRAEAELRRWDATTSSWVLNNELFGPDVDGDGFPEDIDDPRFFIADGTPAKAGRIFAWLRRSRIMTDINRYDMIQPVYNKGTRQVSYVANKPQLIPSLQFTPVRRSAEAVEGSLAVRSGEESTNSAKLGPDVYRTQYGGWSTSTVKIWPSVVSAVTPWLPNVPATSDNVVVQGAPRLDVGGVPVGYSVYWIERSSGRNLEIFDVSAYRNAQVGLNAAGVPTAGLYPFSYGMTEANARSSWSTVPDAVRDFIPFVIDSRRGKVVTSFPITEVGNGGALPAGVDNRPISGTGLALTPGANEATLPARSATNFQAAAFNPANANSRINQRFNVLWLDWDLMPGASLPKREYCKRFIDLRVTPNRDGEPTPLSPNSGFIRPRIVPGSEIIIGPDQTPGPNLGRPIRYTRVSTGIVGPNEYKINYVDQPMPTDSNFLTSLGLNPLAAYNANDFWTAIILPQFKAGYLELNSDPGQPLPDGNISVFYRFQFNESADNMSVDYDTRQLMDVNLTIRNFPGGNLPEAQTITLRGSAGVRNFIR